MFFVALITFSLAHLAPGNPFDKNPNRPMPQETIDRISRFYGVDQPIPVQLIAYLSMLVATIGTTIPGFVLAIFLIYIFGVNLHLLPFVGWGSWQHMVMPMFVLGLGAGGFLTRITRASMLEAIRQDYVRTARSKGLQERSVIVGHALKNALIPIATIIGPATAGLITGSFIIESLFNVPGMGRLYVISILARDYPIIMGTTLL